MNSCCNSGAALLGLLLVSACTDTGTSPSPSPGLCRADATPISAIQGDGYYSPLQDSFATTQGTVTRIKKGEGVYIEDVSTPHFQLVLAVGVVALSVVKPVRSS